MSSSFKDFMKLGLVLTDLENLHLFSHACEFISFDNSEMLGKVGTLHSNLSPGISGPLAIKLPNNSLC